MKQGLFPLCLVVCVPMVAVSAEPDKCCGIKLSGYIDSSYNNLESANQFISGNYNRSLDIQEEGFTLHQIASTLSYLPDQGLGGLVNIIFGRDALTVAPYGYDSYTGNTDVGFTVYQLYGQYNVGKTNIMLGNFNSLAGHESTDPTNNTNFSRSFLSTFSEPNTHFGGRMTYVGIDKFTFIFGLNDGWDNIRDISRDATIELGVAYNPSEMFSFQIQSYSGEERVIAKTNEDPTGFRNLIDVIATYNYSKKLNFVANYDYGHQNNFIYADGTDRSATWSGIAGYVNYGFTDDWRVSLRGEVFSDHNGYRTGVEQTLKEATITIGYSPIKNLEFRLETRRDWSNVNSYVDRDDVLSPRKTQQSYGLEMLYQFANS